MGRVVYSMNVTLDGYVEDASGSIDFSEPTDEVHAAANQDAREAAAFLFGRRVYDIMEDYWTEAAGRDDLSGVTAEFAGIYVDTPRYVFSDILAEVPDGVTLVRRRDADDTVARLKEELDGPLSVAGPNLAASLLDHVDDFTPYVLPVVLGVGKRYWPRDRQLDLRLVDQRTFDNGVVRLHYVRADRG